MLHIKQKTTITWRPPEKTGLGAGLAPFVKRGRHVTVVFSAEKYNILFSPISDAGRPISPRRCGGYRPPTILVYYKLGVVSILSYVDLLHIPNRFNFSVPALPVKQVCPRRRTNCSKSLSCPHARIVSVYFIVLCQRNSSLALGASYFFHPHHLPCLPRLPPRQLVQVCLSPCIN